VRTLREQGLSLPRRERFGTIGWRVPSVASVIALLRNPAYAGAFVYGRARSQPLGPSSRRCRQTLLPMDEWKSCVKDKYPAYISWAGQSRYVCTFPKIN
jgi:hypothetical protein